MVPSFEPGTLESEICFSSTELLTTKNFFLPSNIHLLYFFEFFYLTKAINQMPNKEISKEFLLLQK